MRFLKRKMNKIKEKRTFDAAPCSALSAAAVNDIAQLAGMVMRAAERDTEFVHKNDWFRALTVYAKDVEQIHVPVLRNMLLK